MTQDGIRIGIVGAGENTRARHIPNLQAIEDVCIVSVCNRSLDSSKAVAAEFGIPNAHDDWREVTDADDIDAVVIGTWPDMHQVLTTAALEADKHVLCESRMACNASEARAMLLAAVSRPHLVTQLVPGPATLRVDRTVQRLIADGYVGQVLALNVRAGGNWIDRDAPLHWRHDIDLSGVNIMLLGVWYECICRWIGEATAVTAAGRRFVTARKDASGRFRGVAIPDHIDVIAQMACGAQAHFQISAISALSDKPVAEVFGSDGTLRFTDNKLYAGRRRQPQLDEIEIAAADEGVWRVEEDFIDAIRGRRAVTLTTFADGVKNMDFSEAVVRSMRDQRTIHIPLLNP